MELGLRLETLIEQNYQSKGLAMFSDMNDEIEVKYEEEILRLRKALKEIRDALLPGTYAADLATKALEIKSDLKWLKED